MSVAYDELIHVLDEREIQYSTSENEVVRTDLRGELASYRVVARVESEMGLFQVFAYSPLRAPEGSRQAVAETIVRANYGLRLGKFELDIDDGEIRFQVGQLLVDGALGSKAIDRIICTALDMLDMYLPAILSVIYANELPEDAIHRVEAAFRRPDESEDPPSNRPEDLDDVDESNDA